MNLWFEKGKNKELYTLMMYTDKKNFEFPIKKNLFDKRVDEGRVREMTIDEALAYASLIRLNGCYKIVGR